MMSDLDHKALEQVERKRGSIFLIEAFSDGYEPVPQKVLNVIDHLVHKGELKCFYRFYDEDDPGKYVDFDGLDDVPHDQDVIYPPTGETIFIPRYSEPNKFYYFSDDEKHVENQVEIHADRL